MIASQVPQMLPISLQNSLTPIIFGLEEKKELNSHTIEKSTRYITTLSVPILLLIGTLGKPLVLLFLGQRFVHDWKAFSILTIGHALMSYDIPLTIALAAKKDSKTLALQSVVSSIILGLGTPFLINLYFATGAAIAYVLARFVGFIGVALPRVKKYGLLKIDLKEYGKIAVSSLLMVALTLFLEIETGFSLIMLPLYIIFGLFLLWLTFKLFNILKGEDLIALMESTPKSINGIIVKLWTF
jgi:O-antigen/teichoic acid export membrane protein